MKCNGGCGLEVEHCSAGANGIAHGPHDWEGQGQLTGRHCPGHQAPRR
jgi:hypothetical protein